MYISIIENNEKLALYLQKKLEKEGYFVKNFLSYNHFIDNPYLKSDIFLIDLSLGDGSGFDIIKYIREIKKLNTPIIITSASYDTDAKIYGLNLGADDYLIKIFSIGELIARIKAVLRRNNNKTTSSILKYKNISLDLKTKILKVGKKEVYFTSKEMRLVHYFLANIGIIVNKLDLISSVWGHHDLLSVSDNTINVTISKIRKKLGSSFNLKTMINQGYILKN